MNRITTNLVVPPTLQLPKELLKKNFMYIYNRGFRESPAAFITKLWANLIFPNIINASMGTYKPNNAAFVKRFNHKVSAGETKLKKINDVDDPHFIVDTPLYSFSPDHPSELEYTIKFFTNSNDMVEDIDNSPVVTQMREHNKLKSAVINTIKFPAAHVISAFPDLDANGLASLKECLLGVYIEHHSSHATIFAKLKINKDEAQQLTTTPWLEIRNIDLYPLLMQWVVSVYGQAGRNPLASFPISKIARTLPPTPSGAARINADSISIGPDGIAYYLPEKLDSTQRYEDLFSQVGNQPDDSFALSTVARSSESLVIDPSAKQVELLPVNIPVLIDWVNNKYAYTTTKGILKVLDLARYQAADATHIVNILKVNKINSDSQKMIGQWANLAHTAGIDGKLELNPSDLEEARNFDPVATEHLEEAIKDIRGYFEAAVNICSRLYEDPILTLADLNKTTEYTPLRPIARWIEKVQPAILGHLDAVYHRYSVSYVMSNLALITLVAKYASKFDEVSAMDNKIRSAAINQEVTEGWEPPSIPLLSDNIGLLPHQKKVRNLLKDSPDLAIIPVQAGGGKSVLAITDVLYEIKSNRSQPYLIICPSHLVAQYIKEIVFFTAGKLNAIALNSYAIKQNGLKRIGLMLENAPRNTVVVASYDVLRLKTTTVCYGTTNISVFPIIDFLRQFKFGYCLLDESQNIKNASARTKATMALIADIPKKRLASGTMAHDSPSDLALQIAALDPTVFGTREAFNLRFGSVIRGERVAEWKPGAQQEILRLIKERLVVAGAMRKEWAALLPPVVEVFHRVELTDNQREVYNILFAETLDHIKEAAKTSPRLAEFINGGKSKDKETEDELSDEDALDEFADEDLAAMLNPYLARLEQFITAPASDELGAKMLTGEDLISPKVAKIHEIIKSHIDNKIEGKVLIFTNYTASAEEIYERMPFEIKSKTILYIASDKIEAGAEFENNDSKQVMVGVENSMNVGLNLQHCFPAHTPILIDHNTSVTIKEIFNSDSITHVLSYDLESKKK